MIMRLWNLGFLGFGGEGAQVLIIYYYSSASNSTTECLEMRGDKEPVYRHCHRKRGISLNKLIRPILATEMDDRIIKCMSFYAPTPFPLISRNETSPHNHHKMPRYAQLSLHSRDAKRAITVQQPLPLVRPPRPTQQQPVRWDVEQHPSQCSPSQPNSTSPYSPL